MLKRLLPVLVLLVAIVAAPLVLQRDTEVAAPEAGADRLVIITPHNESIRSEFGEAFAAWWRETTGRSVFIDWRAPGGGGEIKRLLDTAFMAASDLGKEGTAYDVFFGGGDKDFKTQAALGRLAKLDVFDEHPEWFGDAKLPATFSGQDYYGKDHDWVGVCVSQFGIVYNLDVLNWIGAEPPRKWADLTEVTYFGKLALADPTMSSSVNQSFEMIIQEQMQDVIREKGDTPEAREEGWRRGLMVIVGMAANSRYFTDSSSKIPHDVAMGDAAAGTAIDFYGRTQEDAVRHGGKPARVKWIAPIGGTSVSVDPVAVFRGAPHPELAQAFATFCLSERGQLLWNLEVGQEGGPKSHALRRLPVRRDLYTAGNLGRFTDPDALPFERAGEFVYRPDLTSKASDAQRLIIRAMCIDPLDELKEAWERRVIENGEDPWQVFNLDEVGYARVMENWVPLVESRDKLEIVRRSTDLARHFRSQYEALAKGGQP